MLFAGGGDTNGVIYDALDIYNPATDSFIVGPPLPGGRTGYAVVVVGSKAIYAGGLNAHGDLTDAVAIYNADTNCWEVGALFPRPRFGLAAAAVGNKALFVGGTGRSDESSELEDTDAVDVYDVACNSWNRGPPLSGGPRSGIASASVGAEAIFVGGVTRTNNTATDVVVIFNNDTGRWRRDAPLAGGARAYLGATVTKNNLAIFAGGSGPDGLSAAVDIYQGSYRVK